MSHVGNDELKEKELEDKLIYEEQIRQGIRASEPTEVEDDVVEKEWEVTISGTTTVYDETKEGAEQWVAHNLDQCHLDIEAEDNETAEENMLPH